jgi:hypothetical protein
VSTTAPGWHPDPYRRHESRYWDGGRWTEHVSDSGVTAVDPTEWAPPPAATPAEDPTPPAAAHEPAAGPSWSTPPPVATPPSGWGAPPTNVPPAPPTWGATAPGGAWSPTAGRPEPDARDRIPALVGLAGAVVLLVSAFLPWFRIEISGTDFSSTVSGTDGGDGVIIIVLALIAGALALVRVLGKGPPLLGIGLVVTGLLATLIGVVDLGNDDPDDAIVAAFADVSPTVGLWLVILAGLVVTVAGVLMVLSGRARRTGA